MPVLIERSTIWPGQVPRRSDGSLRPPMARLRPWITVHYTGTPSDYADPGDTIPEVKRIQTAAQNAGKPWEYSYVIDTQGQVVEYAGHFEAAHSAGENSQAYGVLLLLGVNQAPTNSMIESFRWLRWVLVSFGNVAPSHQVLPHKSMPGAATICPGDPTMARWLEFLVPWDPPDPAPPTPTPPPTAGGCVCVVVAGDSWWSIARRVYTTVSSTKVDALILANGNKPLRTGETVVIPGRHA